MDSVLPPKLARGDELRIVGPSRSLTYVSETTKALAIKTLAGLGFKVSFGRRSGEQDEFGFPPISARVDDLHDAFDSPEVKAILPAMGGYNSNQMLSHLDYGLIRRRPKIFCGFSDITGLANAIYAKSGLVTYSGPNFASFAMQKGNRYTVESFLRCVADDKPLTVLPAAEWSDDEWHEDQENRTFHRNEGPIVLQAGEAEGVAIGGNLCTLNLLQGTPYMPPLEDAILFLEDDHQANAYIFDRDLQSLIQQPGFPRVKALLIGRFQPGSEISPQKLSRIINTKAELRTMPVAANFDFGHTTPIFTFAIGGRVRISANGGRIKLELLRH